MPGASILASSCNSPSGPPLINQLVGAGTVLTNPDVTRVCVNVVAGPVTIDGQAVSVGNYCFGELGRGPLGYSLDITTGAGADVTIVQED